MQCIRLYQTSCKLQAHTIRSITHVRPVGNPIPGVTYFHAPQRRCSKTPVPLDFSWLEGLGSSCTHCNKAAQQDSNCCNHHCWLRNPEMTVEAVYLSELVGTKGSATVNLDCWWSYSLYSLFIVCEATKKNFWEGCGMVPLKVFSLVCISSRKIMLS